MGCSVSSNLPPLNALKVFEVSARKLSFSAAATELCVTQGAVSKQIKILEAYLQLSLFDRTSKGLRLTEAGNFYLPTVMAALEQIHSSTVSLQQSNSSTRYLTINVSPSLSNLWLIPRLNKLSHAFPSLRLNIVSGDGAYQFHQASADIAIRCLPISLNHQNSILLREEILLPVIHNNLIADSPIQGAKDLLRYQLIGSTTRPQLWQQCLSSLLNNENWESKPDFYHSFEHFFMSLEAANQGQGLALIPDFLAESYIDSGNAGINLSNPLGLSYVSGYGYYLLMPLYRHQDPVVKQVYQWFKDNLSR